MVAPVRERGLKSCGQCLGCRLDNGRSREGAWIEMVDYPENDYEEFYGRSREGAWIEISDVDIYRLQAKMVAPVRERGLKYRYVLSLLVLS